MKVTKSFKQPCPSCGAGVPIRDPKLIGKKVDCPECKFRFVVEAPKDQPGDGDKVSKKKAGKESKGKDKSTKEAETGKNGEGKKKKKAAGDEGGVSMARNVVMGVVLVILVGVAGYVFYDRSQKQKEADTTAAKSSDDGDAPSPTPRLKGGGSGGPVPTPAAPQRARLPRRWSCREKAAPKPAMAASNSGYARRLCHFSS